MEEGEENDRAEKDAYLPISRSLVARRATGINNEDGLSLAAASLEERSSGKLG